MAGGDLALVRLDRRVARNNRSGPIRGRIIVGDRAAERAHVAHLTIADAVGKHGERRDRALHHRRVGHVGMPRHRADHEGVTFFANAGQFGNAAKVDERAGLCKSKLHRCDKTLPACERLAARARKRLCSVGERFRKLVFERVHSDAP